MLAVRSARRWAAALAIALLVTACTTSGDDDSSSGSTDGGSSTALGRGVTADTIRIGFSYIDLEALAKSGVIKISHGPYEPIIKALVDDVNANGGINGRKLELFTAKYSPIGDTEQLAACTKLTEDDKVFVVLNGFLNINNLCVVQQHGTALIGGGTTALTPANLARAKAPWASSSATSERSIDALVEALDQNGSLDGKTIGVYAAQAANKPLIDVAKQALTDAGHPPAVTALMDAPDSDLQAATRQDNQIAQRMMNAGVDTVIDVGQFIPGADFDAAGFYPSLYTLEAGNIAAAAFTNPLGKFPLVGALGASAKPDAELDTEAFQRCEDVWKQASNKAIKSQLQEDVDGKSSGNVAMQIACTAMQIFVEGATAAGKNLNNETLTKGIESIGKITFASGTQGSFGPEKLDGQDTFQLVKYDANWKQGEGKPQFIAVGDPITLSG